MSPRPDCVDAAGTRPVKWGSVSAEGESIIRADLHIHTDRSDGAVTPAQAVRAGHDAGLDVMAVTDHDAVSGLDEAFDTAESLGVRLIAGVEMTALLDGREIHLLSYFPRRDDTRKLEGFLATVQRARRERIRAGIRALRMRGVDIRESQVLTKGADSFTRLHLAQALVELGYASTHDEAFRRFLDARFGSVPQLDFDPETVIDLVHQHRGLAVWAHPDVDDFDRFIGRLKAAGLDGIETHNFRRPANMGVLREAAQAHGLLATGGSDWHGTAHEKPLGTFAVDDRLAQPFLDALNARGMQ